MSGKSSKNNNIIESVCKNNLCCGCGCCAGICPTNALKMQLNVMREYQPVQSNTHECANCGLCLAVCPFASKEIDPVELWAGGESQNDILGPNCGTFVGYSLKDNQRLQGASGGVMTWVGQKMLEAKMVDAVISVGAESSTPFRKFRISKTAEELQNTSTSSYYPVEISSMLKYIKDNPGRYAVTALPCLAKALRAAMVKLPWLKERLRYILGLTCGGQRSTLFVEYLAAKNGINIEDVQGLKFRVKDKTKPANNFGLSFLLGNNKSKTTYWLDGMDSVWYKKWFMLNSCQFCEDIFADYADISFMDAWLDGYREDYKGHSIWIVRNPELKKLLSNASDLNISDIDPKLVCKSQSGVVKYKKEELKTRCSLADSLNLKIPEYLPKTKTKMAFHKKIRVKNQMQRLLASGPVFVAVKSVSKFGTKMKKYDRIESMVNLPGKIIKKLRTLK